MLSAITGALTIVTLVIAGYIAWFMRSDSLPDLESIEGRNFELTLATVAYTADGKVLGRYGHEDRTWVDYEDLPDYVVHALVSTEDHRFWNHSGVDLWRTFSAATQTALGSLGLPLQRQGGSTITQQLARNLYNKQIGFEVSVKRKLKEMAAAVQLERRYAKEEIIEMYLNTVPFRHNAFGIEAAARTYFRESATALDTLEAATLVGMLQATTFYDPVRNPERSRARRNTVLRRMIYAGALNQDFYEANKERLTPTDLQTGDVANSFAPYAAEYVRVRTRDIGRERRWAYDMYTDGLKVYTTIDSRYQESAQAAATKMANALQAVADCEWSASRSKRIEFGENLDRYLEDACHQDSDQRFAYFWQEKTALVTAFIQETDHYQVLQNQGLSADEALRHLQNDSAFMDSLRLDKTRLETGFISMDPESGHVKAWVGGRDLRTGWFDHVNMAKRQPGSTFKPLVYTAAIHAGWTPTYQYKDSVYSYRILPANTIWAPENSGDKASNEYYTLREALARSLNTISAQLIDQLGPEQVVQFAQEMGITSELLAVPSLALGTSEVTLLEMATAYSTLASLGTMRSPVVITRIEDQYGKTIYEYGEDQEIKRSLDEETAKVIVDMMRDVIDKGYGTGQRIRHGFGQVGYDFAGKTGTTQEGADGWFMLLHPQLVSGAWVGFDDLRVTFRSTFWGQGAHNALFVVGDFLQRINADPETALNQSARFPYPNEPPERGETTVY